MGRWVDPAIDGLHYLVQAREQDKPKWREARDKKWQRWLGQFVDVEAISDPRFVEKPDKSTVHTFVRRILDECATKSPRWISVPQLPHAEGTGRNRINRMMADATATWYSDSPFSGRLVVPAILTHQDQLSTKVARTARIKASASSFQRAKAHGIWIVDQSLNDSKGSNVLRNTWLPNLVSLHEELLKALPHAEILVGGPYWAINLVVWARGLITRPGISLGTSYRYYASGGIYSGPPSVRVAIPPIRQRVRVGPELGRWLDKAIGVDALDNRVRDELRSLRHRLPSLNDRLVAQRQVADFYRKWLDTLASVPRAGRAMALYQDFSTAYVVGRMLPQLPRAEGTARHRGRVAETFMLSCL